MKNVSYIFAALCLAFLLTACTHSGDQYGTTKDTYYGTEGWQTMNSGTVQSGTPQSDGSTTYTGDDGSTYTVRN